jgi:hypothetical protein
MAGRKHKMVELTYGELKQGLLCCTVYRDCTNCPLYINDDLGSRADCTYALMSAAMNCINVMEKDLADANKRAEDWEDTATKHEQEIIRLHESQDR